MIHRNLITSKQYIVDNGFVMFTLHGVYLTINPGDPWEHIYIEPYDHNIMKSIVRGLAKTYKKPQSSVLKAGARPVFDNDYKYRVVGAEWTDNKISNDTYLVHPKKLHWAGGWVFIKNHKS